MKKILLILALMLPVLSFGQVLQEVEMIKEMEMFSFEAFKFREISNPYEIKEEEFNSRIKNYPFLTTPSFHYRLWSGCRIHPVYVFPVYGKRA